MTSLQELDMYCLMSGQNLDVASLRHIKREIRIFTSFADRDMDLERMTLMAKVYKPLRLFCRCKYGIECYMFDPRWGLEHFPSLSSFEFELKKMVYNESKLYSLGPYFMAFIGQKYGASEPAKRINRYEFECIFSALELHRSRSSRDFDVLRDCYRKDGNSFSRDYLLTGQAISSMRQRLKKNFQLYGEGSLETSGCAQARVTGEISEKEATMTLASLLRHGATLGTRQTKFEGLDQVEFLKSDFHKELEKALRDCDMDRCLVVSRTIKDLENFSFSEESSKFTEFTSEGARDGRYSVRLGGLKEEFKRRNVDLLEFDVLWRFPGGMDQAFHQIYLDEMAESVLKKMKDKIVKLLPQTLKHMSPLEEEVLHHLQMAANLVQRFVGREDVLGESRSYICNSCHHMTSLIIHGKLAIGKATLGSKIFMEAPNWMAGICDVIRVVRFVGSTRISSDLIDLLDSIVSQIKMALGCPEAAASTSAAVAVEAFRATLDCFPHDKRLLILLVSMEKIDAKHDARAMRWLSRAMKSNVRLVVTVESSSRVMTSVSEMGQQGFSFVELGPISESEGTAILLLNMASYGRTLTAEQVAVVSQNCFNVGEISPLLPLVLASHMIVLESWQRLDAESVRRFDCVERCFNALMEKMELILGSDVTARIVSYLSSSSGLSDCEMEDVLTRDPAIAGYLAGSKETQLKFPPMAWMLVRYALRPLLREQFSHGVVTRVWRHEIFAAVATNRYLINIEDARSINCLLAEHWLSVKGPEGWKQVLLDQPIRFDTKDAFEFCSKNPPLYNKRLLDQLPVCLKRAERDEEIVWRIAFNFEWLFSKTISLSLRRVIYDLRLVPTPEVQILEEAMIDAEPFINDDVTNMAYELTRRLLMFRRRCPRIGALVDAMDMRSGAFIVALPACKVPVCALDAEVECRDALASAVMSVSRGRHVILCKNPRRQEVEVVCIKSRRHLSSLTTSLGGLFASPNGRWLGLVECTAGLSICINVHDLDSGSFAGHVLPTTTVGSVSGRSILSHVIIGDHALCYVVSGERSWFSAKSLDGTGSDLDKDLAHVDLPCRPDICQITPDQSMVFMNSGRTLIGCPVSKLANGGVMTLNLNLQPVRVCFNEESNLAFVAFQGNYLSGVDFSLGVLDLRQSFDLSAYLKDDVIRDLVHHKRGQIIIRSDNHLVLFDICRFFIKFRLNRPDDLLYEFRFPRSPAITKIKFQDAIFVGDHVAAAILRDIRIFDQDGCTAAILKAPVGLLFKIFSVEPSVEKSDDESECSSSSHPPPWLIASILENYKKLQIWRLDRAGDHVNGPDRIPAGNVRQVELAGDGKVIAARGEGGHEIGIFDAVTGQITDLMTHECPVKDFCLSGNGRFLMVSMVSGKKGRVNKVWDVRNRKMLAEFEDASSVTIAAQTRQRFFCFVEEGAQMQTFKIYRTTLKPVKKVIVDQSPEATARKSSSGEEKCGKDSNIESETSDKITVENNFCSASGIIEGDVTIDLPVLPTGRQWRAIIDDTGVKVTKLKQRPFVTCHDGWLIALLDDHHDEGCSSFIRNRIFAVRLKKETPRCCCCYNETGHVANTGQMDSDSESEEADDLFAGADRGGAGDDPENVARKDLDLTDRMVQIYPSDLRRWARHLQVLVLLRKHQTEGDLIVVFFSNECDDSKIDSTCCGFLVVDVSKSEAKHHIEDLLPPMTKLERTIFSGDMRRVYDTKSNVFSLCDASWIGQVKPEFKFCPGRKAPRIEGGNTEEKFGWPLGIILNDRAILYLKDDHLTAVRLSDCTILGRVSVHTRICGLAIGADRRTVYVGGSDGSVTSYVVVDREEEGDKMAEIIANIPSRKTTSFPERVWDVRKPFPDYSRPPSMPPPYWKGTEDLNKLNEAKTAFHPSDGDPQRKSTRVSKACCLM